MTRLETRLKAIVAEGRKVLSVYVTAGLPSRGSFPDLVAGIAGAGADIVELGIPFSDPLADGPVIQASHARGLREGITPGVVLAMAAEIRNITAIPIILMGYINPLLSYGLERFIVDAAASGVAGLIVPDLPPEEATLYREAAAWSGLSTIFLAAPTTPVERIVEIDRLSTGFVYGVSTLGVTGAREGASAETIRFIERARASVTRRPLLAGFGISDPETAKAIASRCDGVIVGSAVVAKLGGPDPREGRQAAAGLITSIRRALDQ